MRKERSRSRDAGGTTYWQDAHSGVKITRGSRKTFICKSKHSSLFIECQREYLRPIFVSSGAEGTDERVRARGRKRDEKTRIERNKNITFRDGGAKGARETSGPSLVFHRCYIARQIECLFSEK